MRRSRDYMTGLLHADALAKTDTEIASIFLLAKTSLRARMDLMLNRINRHVHINVIVIVHLWKSKAKQMVEIIEVAF